jgi:hypothetical protein
MSSIADIPRKSPIDDNSVEYAIGDTAAPESLSRGNAARDVRLALSAPDRGR